MNQIAPKNSEGGELSSSETSLEDASGGDPARRPKGKGLFALLRFVLLGVLFAVLGLWAWDWSRTAILYVHETDARIMADMVSVSSRVAGQIETLSITDGQTVEQGETLVILDGRQALLRLAEMESELAARTAERARIGAEILRIEEEVQAEVTAARASLVEAEKRRELRGRKLKYAEAELKRARSLSGSGAISAARLDRVQTDFLEAEQEMVISAAEIESARAMVRKARSGLSEIGVWQAELTEIEAEENRIRARIAVQTHDIEQRTITSPVTGVASETFVSGGEFVAAGQRIAMIHDPSKIWVQSNIRETEIGRVRVGQSVRIEVDALPDEEFTGTVERIGHAATSQFALLPALNSSGNFTKVTQRLEVRIAVEQSDGRLKPGMMVEIFIDADKKNLF